MPRKGYKQSEEHRRKRAAGIAAARTSTSQSQETRERIAAGQRAAWSRRLKEQVTTLRRMAEEAPTAKARAYLEAEADRVERRAR